MGVVYFPYPERKTHTPHLTVVRCRMTVLANGKAFSPFRDVNAIGTAPQNGAVPTYLWFWAISLQPECFAGSVLAHAKHIPHHLGGIFLGVSRDMGAGIEGNACGEVAQHARDVLDIHAVLQGGGREGMSQMMGHLEKPLFAVWARDFGLTKALGNPEYLVYCGLFKAHC